MMIVNGTGKAISLQLNIPQLLSNKELTFNLFNLSGQLVNTMSGINCENRNLIMNTVGTRSGTYVLKVLNGKQTVLTNIVNLQ